MDVLREEKIHYEIFLFIPASLSFCLLRNYKRGSASALGNERKKFKVEPSSHHR